MPSRQLDCNRIGAHRLEMVEKPAEHSRTRPQYYFGL